MKFNFGMEPLITKMSGGANFYPQDRSLDFISLINVQPPHNRFLDISDEQIRKRIEAIINKLLI